MDRQIVYPGQIPLETDLLNTNRNTMLSLGALIGDIFGKVTTYSGLGCVPTIPATLGVNVNPGSVYSLQNVDNTAYSSLPSNQSQQIMKQGILATAANFATPAPVTAGYSVNYLISAAFLEVDIGSVVLPYYNATNPQQAWSGPGGLGGSNTTTRQNTVALTLTAGIAATTGTQTTPATPTGQTPLYVVTVAYGQSTVTTANISQVANQSILPGSLLATVQANLATYALDTGTANTYKAAYFPAVTALVDGMILAFEAKNSNTGASTFSPNGLTAYPIIGGAHVALNGTEIIAGGKVELMWKANINSWVVLETTAGSQQVSSLYATGKINGVNSPNLLFNGSAEFGSSGWTNTAFSSTIDPVGHGSYFINSSAISGVGSDQSGQITLGAGVQLTLSANIYAAGVTGGVAHSYVTAYNSSNSVIGTVCVAVATNGTGWTRYAASGLTPANTAYVRVVMAADTSAVVSANGLAFGQIKIELGATASLYSQEASIAPGTAPQFDSSLRPATTAFVQRALGNYATFLSYTASATLTAAQAGAMVNFWGATASQTITLPAVSGMGAGAGFYFVNTASVPVSITRAGTDALVVANQASLTTIVLQPGDDLECYAANSGTQWVLGGSSIRQFNVLYGATPPQFDNSTKLATTGFVQRALGNFQAFLPISASTVLTAAQSGSFVEYSGVSAGTITLPAPTTANLSFTIMCSVAVGSSITTPSGSITSGNNGYTTFPLSTGSSVQLVSDGTNWIAYSGQGTGALTSNGYQKLPSGMIIQWGTTGSIAAGGSTSVTFPIAFPNNFFMGGPFNSYAVGSSGAPSAAGVSYVNKSSMTVYLQGSSGMSGVPWIAIGN